MKRNSIVVVIIFVLMTIHFHSLTGQNLKNKKSLSFLPSLDTEINGVGLGLAINSLKYNSDTLTTIVNGLNIELVGVGIILPLAPVDPMEYRGLNNLDSLIEISKEQNPYQINGVSISFGGLAGHEVNMSGLNISGANTYISCMKGVSLSILFNYSEVLRGVSIGAFNRTLETRGVQIGLINRAEKLKGFQIGLWNYNGKIGLPLINWNFKG